MLKIYRDAKLNCKMLKIKEILKNASFLLLFSAKAGGMYYLNKWPCTACIT
jgi:hypothetical protein